MVNVDCELLNAYTRRITQQRTFDRKPLGHGVAVCYGCGHLLWSCVDGAHTFLVNKPSGMTEDTAPASAYLRAVPSCTAGFVYTERGNSTKERWCCCPFCKSKQVPSDQHVDTAPASANLRAVPSCIAGFVYTERGNSTKERWYCCPFCKSKQVPSDQHVGHVLDASLNAKPIDDWDMSFPVEVQSLANQYERGQMSLCGLFSSTVREASMTQYRHIQG